MPVSRFPRKLPAREQSSFVRVLPLLMASGSTLALLTSAHAQEVALPTITVSPGPADTDGTDSYTTDSSTAGGKVAARIKETPRSISVITRRRLDDENITTIAQAAERATGVFVNENDANDGPFIYSRGFLMSLSENGVPLDSANYRQGFDTAIYDRIEFLRGPDGLIQGQGQPGGSINLVHKRPTAIPKFMAETSAGQWNDQRGVLDLSTPLVTSGAVRGRFVVSSQQRDSWLPYVGQDKLVGFGVVEADLTDTTLLTLRAITQDSEIVPYYGGVTYSNSTQWTPRNLYGGASWNKFDYQRSEGTAKLEQRLSENWTLSATGTYRVYDDHKRVAFHNPLLNAAGDSTLTNRATWFEGNHFTGDVHLSGRLSVFDRTHQITVGANMERFDFHTWTRNAASVGLRPFGNPDIPYQELTKVGATWRDFDIRQSGFYAQSKIEIFNNLHLHVGGRVSSYYSDQQNLSGASLARSVNYDEKGAVTPYGGLVLDVTKEWTVYVSYADIFRPQFTTDVDASNTVLPPMVGRQYEAGVKASLLDGRLNASLAVFDIRDTNRALPDPINPGSSIAAGEVQSRGYEAEISGKILPEWQLVAGYSFTDTKFLNAATTLIGTTFNGFVPAHSVKLWSNYTIQHPGLLRGLELGFGIRAYSSNYTAQGLLVFEQEAYSVADARIAYNVNEHVTLALNVTNLFDTTYVPYPFPRAIYGEPRRAMLKATAKW